MRLHSTSDATPPESYSDKAFALRDRFLAWYDSQVFWKRLAIQFGVVLGAIAAIVALIFHRHIIRYLVKVSDSWQQLKYGQVILFLLIFFVGFPPLIGFSALSMLSGMIYGFPHGWYILAPASILGSFCSFLVFRYMLNSHSNRLINSNDKFRALAEILKEKESSLLLLVLIRCCPLPYSLTNGALALVPELPGLTFILASLITSPRLMIHIFVGAKLKELGDETKSKLTKIVDLISIILTVCAAMLTTYIIYSKMQQKLATYENQETLDDRTIFGNFEDDLETGSTDQGAEMNFADFDADNFIIEDDEDEPLDTVKVAKNSPASRDY